MQGLPRLIMHRERRDFNTGSRHFNDKARTRTIIWVRSSCIGGPARPKQRSEASLLHHSRVTQNFHSFPFPQRCLLASRSFEYNTLAGGCTVGEAVCSGLSGMKGMKFCTTNSSICNFFLREPREPLGRKGSVHARAKYRIMIVLYACLLSNSRPFVRPYSTCSCRLNSLHDPTPCPVS